MGDETTTPGDLPYRGPAELRWFPHNEILERAVMFRPGYNDRNGPYGVHGMEVHWLLRGPKGAVGFIMSTEWVPGERGRLPGSARSMFPMGFDLGYHAHIEQWEGQGEILPPRGCSFLDGGKCYYDGSALRAMEIVPAFLRDGEAIIWNVLEGEYERLKRAPLELER